MAAKRFRAECPDCTYPLVKASHGKWLPDGKWWCHRCGAVVDAKMTEVKART